MKIYAKNNTLTFDTKVVEFDIRKKDNLAYIDYYDSNEFIYQLECPVQQADKIYKQCIVEGYSESF